MAELPPRASYHNMKTWGGEEKLHAFLTSVIDGGAWSSSTALSIARKSPLVRKKAVWTQ